MIWFILLTAVFLIMLTLPLAWAAIWYYRSKNSVLQVRQKRNRDPRYFAKSFEAKFNEAWAKRKDGKIKMSKEETYLLADETDLAALPDFIDRLVVAQENDLELPKDIQFEGEIYAAKNMKIAPRALLRAALVKGSVTMGSHSYLERWLDAGETIAVYDDCRLGISLTADKAICVGKNCAFRRMFAPVIHLGAYPEDKMTPSTRNGKIYTAEKATVRLMNCDKIDEANLGETGMVQADVITENDLTVSENIVITGDVRCEGNVYLKNGSTVCGNIFADRSVSLEDNVTVLGSIFSQEDIAVGNHAVIGRKGRVCSVIARGNMEFGENCFVYGYISNEAGGFVCPEDEESAQPAEALDDVQPQEQELCYLPWVEQETELSFENAQEFNRVDDQGFRHRQELKKITVPAGVTKIPDSMFFDCTGLETLILPKEIQEIGSYAFADCKKLKKIDLSAMHGLKTIRRSAFDGCTQLKEVILPAGIKEIGPAAFFNCTALEKITLPPQARIETIGSHCFMHCPLKEVPQVTAVPAEQPAEQLTEQPAEQPAQQQEAPKEQPAKLPEQQQ